ncbi:hypothetical protein BH18ACT4_BH18ACT4_07170 [soil metagenome]
MPSPTPGDGPDARPEQARPEQGGSAQRRRDAAVAGHSGDVAAARRLLADPDPGVRATALSALARQGVLSRSELAAAVADGSPTVRRRAAEVAATGTGRALNVSLSTLLRDDDPIVVEVAA